MNLWKFLCKQFSSKKTSDDFPHTEAQKDIQSVLNELKKTYQEINSLKEQNKILRDEIENFKKSGHKAN